MSLLWDIVQIGFNFLLLGVFLVVWKLLMASTPWWDKRRQARKDVLLQYQAMKKETKERTNMSTDDYSPDNPPYWVRHTPKPGIIGLDMDFIRGIAAEAEQKEAWRRREAQRQGSEAPSQESEALRLQLEAIAQKLLDEQARLLELGASTTEPPLPPKPSQSDDA